ncbi:MAG: PLP-dependent aminotransferase family protein [Bacillaceae bacterium]|nr:PLP-dependent aminotransferase family protein [Bacillaceae bacterium]
MNTIDWKPDKTNTVPVYQQIVQFIKQKIANGEWPVGFKLPSQRELAAMFGVNRSTVITALDELMADGLIQGEPGKGTRVVNNTWSLLTAASLDWRRYVEAGMYQPNLPAIQEINRAEADPGILRLSTGELSPELFPASDMKQVLTQVAHTMDHLGYEEPKGYVSLRREISRYVKRFGIDVSPSSILIVSGALQALQLISVGLLQRGATVLLEKPSYLFSLPIFQSAGVRLSGLPMDEQGIQPDMIPVHNKKQNGAFLYTIPSFHNPTGYLMTEERRRQLYQICEAEQLPIVEDDVYRELWIDAEPPLPLKARDQNGLVLYLGSLSKTLSPGLRIGWVIGPEPVINRLADIKMQTDYGSSSLSQRVATEWLAGGLYDDHVRQVRQELKKRRDAAVQVLEAHFHDIAEWNVPQGGFYIWLKILPSVSMRKLFHRALVEKMLINPGHVYHQGEHQYVRISYSYASIGELHEGLGRLARLIREEMA